MAIKIDETGAVVVYENEPEQARELFPNITEGSGKYISESGTAEIDANLYTVEFSGQHDRIPDVFCIVNTALVDASGLPSQGFMFGCYTGLAHILGLAPVYLHSSGQQTVGLESFTVRSSSTVPRPTQVFYQQDGTNYHLTNEGYEINSIYATHGTFKWFALWID